MIRRAQKTVEEMLGIFPAVALLGARQVGKTTLARKVAGDRPSVLFDLEKEADRRLLLSDASGHLCEHDGKLIVLDEVQKIPNIFEEIRVAIDHLNPDAPGRFLLLGSASGSLLRQSRENLYGRVATVELFGLDCLEIAPDGDPELLWRRGGFPRSYLAEDDATSMKVRSQICRPMFVENLAAAESKVSADSLERLLACLARQQGGIANMQEIAGELEITATTVTRHVSMLEQMMLVRRLPAFARAGGQSSVKRPRYYIRDSGILHSMSNMESAAEVAEPLGSLRGASWEGFVIENIMAVLPPLWQASFYRTHGNHEIDLILQKPGGALWAIEIKSSPDVYSIRLSKGNFKAIEQLQPERCFVVHGATAGRRLLPNNLQVLPLTDMMNELLAVNERQTGAFASTRKRSDSGRLATLLAALNSGRTDVPPLRNKFIDFCLQRIKTIFRSSRGANDEAARREWLGVRKELVEWLRLECQLDNASGGECGPKLAKSVKTLLKGILSLKLTPSISGRGAIIQADLCTCDMFVHVIAILLENDKFRVIHDLLEHGYLAARKLRDYRDFYYDISGHRFMYNAKKSLNSGSERLPAEDADDELHEHIKTSPLELDRLLEAEQVIFCHGVMSGAGKTIFPRILVCVPDRALQPLEFFQLVQTSQGRVNLVGCIKKKGESFSLAGFGSKVGSRMNELLDNEYHYRKWREIMGIDKWP